MLFVFFFHSTQTRIKGEGHKIRWHQKAKIIIISFFFFLVFARYVLRSSCAKCKGCETIVFWCNHFVSALSESSPSQQTISRIVSKWKLNQQFTSWFQLSRPPQHLKHNNVCVCVCVCLCGEGWLVGFLAGWVARREDIEERKHTQQSVAIWICV